MTMSNDWNGVTWQYCHFVSEYVSKNNSPDHSSICLSIISFNNNSLFNATPNHYYRNSSSLKVFGLGLVLSFFRFGMVPSLVCLHVAWVNPNLPIGYRFLVSGIFWLQLDHSLVNCFCQLESRFNLIKIKSLDLTFWVQFRFFDRKSSSKFK